MQDQWLMCDISCFLFCNVFVFQLISLKLLLNAKNRYNKTIYLYNSLN